MVRFTTTKGTFEVELYPEKAPITVANFITLVKTGFYDNIYFHRVVPGFVIQGGDPRGDGWGGPGYAIPCEYNDIFYTRGIVGMAHAGKDTGGSQFFITQAPQPHLNGKHTAFGKVVRGMKVVDTIEVYDRIISAELTK
ncbi:MAG: peptidylprolyl isomerase [Calditrichia bacterium]